MKVLLDTHLVLWWMANDRSLTKQARDLIAAPSTTVFVSAVSLWEIWLKGSIGKLRIAEEFEEKLAAESFESLPLTAIHARQVAWLPWRHRDPFDRMLVAQALADNLTLLTADDTIARYGEFVRPVR